MTEGGRIVIDTSAIMAILLREPGSERLVAVLERAESVSMSAGTWIECMVVAHRRGIAHRMRAVLADVAPDLVVVDGEAALRCDVSFALYGKGLAPAGLNFGDMFAYDAAMTLGAPLLYVGDDFARTDVRPAI